MARNAGEYGAGGGKAFLAMGAIMGVVFLPTSTLLALGMAPTVVAALVDRSRRKTKAVTVGAMNLAGAVPFLLDLWKSGNTIQNAVEILQDPMAITVMYSAAALGYLIDWAVTGMVATLLYQKGLLRQKYIQQRREELERRWGPEVTGDIPLDNNGFPIQADAPKAKNKP